MYNNNILINFVLIVTMFYILLSDASHAFAWNKYHAGYDADLDPVVWSMAFVKNTIRRPRKFYLSANNNFIMEDNKSLLQTKRKHLNSKYDEKWKNIETKLRKSYYYYHYKKKHFEKKLSSENTHQKKRKKKSTEAYDNEH